MFPLFKEILTNYLTSWVLAKITSESSHCFWKGNRNWGRRLCIMVCPSFWADYYMLIYTHCWELMNSVGGHSSSLLLFVMKVTVHLELYIYPGVSNCFELAKHKYRYTKIKIIIHSQILQIHLVRISNIGINFFELWWLIWNLFYSHFLLLWDTPWGYSLQTHTHTHTHKEQKLKPGSHEIGL